MPQELHVLCCYACGMYQVHIVKKIQKWQCKICNEKQSTQTVYFKGSGSDCRRRVQDLNATNTIETEDHFFASSSVKAYSLNNTVDETQDTYEGPCPKRVKLENSKWSKYLQRENEEMDSLSEEENLSIIANTQENITLKNDPCSQLNSGDLSNLNKAGSSKEQSFCTVDTSLRISNELDKYIVDDEKDEVERNSSQDNKFVKDSTPTFQSTKISIFDDYNDELDFTIDF